MKKYFQKIDFNNIKKIFQKIYLYIFRHIKPIFSHTWISYIASIFTILASLSILQYLQFWCFLWDYCEEKIIGKIWYWLQRNYIESIIKTAPLIVTEWIQDIEVYDMITDTTNNIKERTNNIYYELKHFYIQVVYDKNNNSQCVFITAKDGNIFSHPYLSFWFNDGKVKINRNSFYEFGWEDFISRDNFNSTFWYVEKSYIWRFWGYLTLYYWINQAWKNKSQEKYSIPSFSTTWDATITNTGFIYDIAQTDTYWWKINSNSDIHIYWENKEMKNNIDNERKLFIPNTFWFWNYCENYHGVDRFDIQYKRNLDWDEYLYI